MVRNRVRIYARIFILKAIVLLAFSVEGLMNFSSVLGTLYIGVMALLLILILYESYIKPPMITTKAKVLIKHPPPGRFNPNITFLLPDGKTCRLDMGGKDYSLLKIGDEVTIKFKGDILKKIVEHHKK